MAAFQILTRGLPARAEEWLLAQETPIANLPVLSEEDQQRARIRHLSDEQYARHLLLRQSARKRESEEGERIGKVILDLFEEWKAGFHLKGIVKRGFEPGWCALIELQAPGSGSKFFEIPLPTEDFSDERDRQVLNVANPEEIREYLRSKLGWGEYRAAAS